MIVKGVMKRCYAIFLLILSGFVSYGQGGDNYVETAGGAQIRMVLVKGGTFMMGSPRTEMDCSALETQHQVQVDDFYIGKFEITQAQWSAIMGNNPSFFKGCDNCPVETVSWTDAQSFITRLNELSGKTYSLPTEAQWEYACRGGTTGPYSTGSCLDANQANYDGKSPYVMCDPGPYKEKTTAAGSYKQNAFGLCDMHGNVHEWCADWYGSYIKDSIMNPRGPDTGTFRVIRGGNWNVAAKQCRSASRNYFTPEYKGRNVGFRIVCKP